jgi:hypothetical protein
MNDRELLELAAKALGGEIATGRWNGVSLHIYTGEKSYVWNPLIDDGDALRLAVSLCIQVDPLPLSTFVGWTFVQGRQQRGKEIREHHDGDEMAATRRAIVRAAAYIGEQLP